MPGNGTLSSQLRGLLSTAGTEKTSVTSVQILGLDELLKNINKIQKVITSEKIRSIYADGARVIAQRARQLAPYDPKRKKGTHLRDAIFIYARNPRESFVLVGVRHKPKGAPHAHLLEFGHATRSGGFAAPRPYMRPAVVEKSPEAAKIIIDGVWKAIEEAVGSGSRGIQ